ncbi:glycosyltransferase [Cytophagaceae bacterium ABcell3]|nr:glycosyltransferase [Cytophagaceae bacterium ABcell3]
MKIVILGLSLTSSWGNGHATTFRGLIKELTKKNHHVTFLERDVPWYASSRDLPNPDFCDLHLYKSLEELKDRWHTTIKNADLVIVGSYVPQGVKVGEWVQNTTRGIAAFYDIDTPVTLAKLERKDYEYLKPELIPAYDLYLSFTGGPTLDLLEKKYNSPKAKALYCSFDPNLYHPVSCEKKWDLGYLGTYSTDRQPPLNNLMLKAATVLPEQRFVVAGAQYPDNLRWPKNTEHIHHLPPADHSCFYNSQRFTMNITRADMIRAGYSPSVRLFEAAACGTPVISDDWDGLTTLFKEEESILIARKTSDTTSFLQEIPDSQRRSIGENARKVVMENHTAAHRAAELEEYVRELTDIGINV